MLSCSKHLYIVIDPRYFNMILIKLDEVDIQIEFTGFEECDRWKHKVTGLTLITLVL